MIHEQRTDVDGLSPAGLREEYDADLRSVIDGRGVDAVVEETKVDREIVAALADGESPTLSVADAAAIQALDADAPDADTIVEMAWEHLLLGMSSAVLDVETLASEADTELSAKEIQQKLERRAGATLDEFVAVEHAIVDRQY
ncbi:DUF5791 family protein [Natronoarchaeum rubrum]|uniref:DUF5791 family protein n=1 Tax=Natronoarchaeum rubrum TaxID=755311 RepID=UPI002111DE00|nr:DUF5791 family protein [Natronoarchaeum rubrum]